MQSNYELTQRRMEEEFLRYPQQEMIERRHLTADADWLCFQLFGSDVRVNRTTGKVECRDLGTDSFRPADYNEAMTAYDLLCTAGPAAPTGEYVHMKSHALILLCA